MNASAPQKSSAYMEWAKLHSQARFSLATSGIMNVPASDFPMPEGPIEITAAGGYGYTPLQQRIARHAGVSADCIVAAAGTSMANHLAFAALLNPGDEVLIEHPTYGLLLDQARYLGARIRRFRRRAEADFAVDLAEMEAALGSQTRLIVLSNLHNPTGALIPETTVRAIGEMALRIGAHVLLDEVYLEMPGLQERSAFHLGPELSAKRNPFLITSSLTKAYGLSGLRCGWIIAAPELARRIWRLNDLFGANAAHPAEQLSVVAFDHLQKFHARAAALLSANRALLETFLDSRRDLRCSRPPAGTVFFPELLSGEMEAFVRLLREKYETSVVLGSFFEMPQHFRIGVGGRTDELRAGLEKLGAALDEFSRSNGCGEPE